MDDKNAQFASTDLVLVAFVAWVKRIHSFYRFLRYVNGLWARSIHSLPHDHSQVNLLLGLAQYFQACPLSILHFVFLVFCQSCVLTNLYLRKLASIVAIAMSHLVVCHVIMLSIMAYYTKGLS